MANFICGLRAIAILGGVLDSSALAKTQTLALLVVIVVAAVVGGLAYVLLSEPVQSTGDIVIGVCGDLDMEKATWQGAVLAVEQLNAEGGILGRNLTVVAEDDDGVTPPYDIVVATNALTKLITVDKADFIVTSHALPSILTFQDICAEHKKILISTYASADNYTQRVLDNYDRYKYFFRTIINETTQASYALEGILTLGNYTGFKKVGFIGADLPSIRATATALSQVLPDHGFEVVYNGIYPLGTTDFTSYFAAMEEAGAEIVHTIIGGSAGVPFVKEYYDRQSRFVTAGIISMAGDSIFWNLTEGKCEYVTFHGSVVSARYPFTSKTVPMSDAYVQRWGEPPIGRAVTAYDSVRFILADAIKKAGTTETGAVIKALESTDVETSTQRHFTFTSSHDVMASSAGSESQGEINETHFLFQWQDGVQVPVYPKEIMDEAGATYKYPPWQGPWSQRQIP